jgi:hypothetical protein
MKWGKRFVRWGLSVLLLTSASGPAWAYPCASYEKVIESQYQTQLQTQDPMLTPDAFLNTNNNKFLNTFKAKCAADMAKLKAGLQSEYGKYGEPSCAHWESDLNAKYQALLKQWPSYPPSGFLNGVARNFHKECPGSWAALQKDVANDYASVHTHRHTEPSEPHDPPTEPREPGDPNHKGRHSGAGAAI